jgi:hypothetical protein
MLSLELLQQVHFPLLVTAGATHLLLPLIIHHLLDHRASRAIQIAQAGVLWRDLRNVDLGRSCHNVRPPFDLVHLVEVDIDFLARWGGGGLEGPGRFIDEDGVGEVALQRDMDGQLLLGTSFR